MGETILELQNIAKHFGDTDVLNGISISIGKGEFITLLGPSGCGKTTTLRIIAGLETPDEGRVILNGQDVTDSEPNKRDVNTVFQNYALFPHMTVAANIGYSLKLKKRPKDEIKKAVDDALALVQLSGYGKRMPAELSGGQRQRVAIARAVVNRPSVLLLDEPLGALDLQLRRQMQLELKALQKQLGITFIYITHDQEEALNMSDRIAVMKDGRFEQLGTPAEVYDSPRTSYVARFVGTANVLTGTVEAVEDDVLKVACAGGNIVKKALPAQAAARARCAADIPLPPVRPSHWPCAASTWNSQRTPLPAVSRPLSGKRRLPAACCASHWSFPTARRSSPAATALIWMCRRATRCA